MATVTSPFWPEEGSFLASAFPSFSHVTSGNFPADALVFDGTNNQAAFFRFVATSYGSGNLTLTIYWYADTATSGDCVWESALACITPGDAQSVETKAFATANTTTTTTTSTADGLNTTVITITNLDSIAAGDLAWLRIRRLSAGNTMGGNAMFLGATLAYSDV